MPKGDAETTRELRGYAALARLGIVAAVIGLASFVFVMRGNIFDPEVANWPLVVAVAVWALGLVTALWARSRIREMAAEANAEASEAPADGVEAATPADAGAATSDEAGPEGER